MILSNLTPYFSAAPMACSRASAVVAWSKCTAIGTLAEWALCKINLRPRRGVSALHCSAGAEMTERKKTYRSTQKRRYGTPPYSNEMGKSCKMAGDLARSAARTRPIAELAS